LAIQSYNTLVNALTQFSNNHLSLKRFKCSFFEQFDNFSTSGNSFPILYAVPQDCQFEENIDRFTFRVYCVDTLQKDRSNEATVLNETLLVLRDLTNWLRLDQYNDLNILNVPRANPINNFLVDFTAGWYIDIEIEATVETSDCSIPFTDNFIFSAICCDNTFTTNFLTCETLAECASFIALEDRVEVLESEVDILNSIVLSQNQLLSGGASFLSGLTYSITPLTYVIGGVFYSAASSTVTTASGDTTYDRIDVIVADISGNTSVVQGTPSANPVSPDIDELTQVEVAIITVAAGSTSLASPATLVYNEKVGPPAEWTFSTPSSPFISGDSTVIVAYSGTVSIALSAATTAKQFTLSSSTVFDSTTQNTIQFAIKNRVVWPGAVGATRLRFTILSSTGVGIGTFVDLYNGKFGFSSSNITSWQLLTIPLSYFALTTTLFSQIRVTTVNTGALAINANLDAIRMIVGTPSVSTTPAWFNMKADGATLLPALVTNDTFTISGGTNIGSSTFGVRGIVLNLDGNINLTGVTATTISATTYLGLPGTTGGGFSGWTGGTGVDSIKANNGTTNASGNYSVAEGLYTLSSGIAGHSEGSGTTASGNYSHSEGQSTTATADNAHSEGYLTKAISGQAHAEGYNTTASADNSHAEGNGSIASGSISHAEGVRTTASGNYSHAEGYETISNGLTSHAEGSGTLASSASAHAEGLSTTASGMGSHSEGNFTTAAGDNSHSEGYLTTAIGLSSHVGGGQDSIAQGDYSFVHGKNSVAIGDTTIVLGNNLTGGTDNTVYTPDIIIETNKSISDSGGGQIAFYGGDVAITNDNGSFNDSFFELFSGGVYVVQKNPFGSFNQQQLVLTDGSVVLGATRNVGGASQLPNGLEIYPNVLSLVNSTSSLGAAGVFLNSSGSQFLSGVTNSVILGGNGVTASESDTAYMRHLSIDIISNDNTLTDILVRDSLTGNIKARTVASILSGVSVFDVFVTGGTYNNPTGTATFRNNTGGTFTVTGFNTGTTDTFVNSFSYNNSNQFTIGNSTGGTLTVLFNTVTGLTSTGTISTSILTATTISAVTYSNIKASISATFDGQGGVLSTGSTSYITMTHSGNFKGWYILSPISGNLIIDVWKAAGAIPTVANSIAGTEKPTLTSQTVNSDTNLTTWTTTSFAQGDIVALQISSASTVTYANIVLQTTKE